jgi:hypothetical protein
MEDSRLTRRDLLKAAVGGVALLLQPVNRVMATQPSSDVLLYVGEPSMGEPGYEERVARIFEQATPRKVQS